MEEDDSNSIASSSASDSSGATDDTDVALLKLLGIDENDYNFEDDIEIGEEVGEKREKNKGAHVVVGNAPN